MSPTSRRLLLAALSLALLLPLAFGQTRDKSDKPSIPITGDSSEKFALVDQLMTLIVTKAKLPGATLAVARDGKLVYSRGFGWADMEKKQEMKPDAIFRISSASKPFTAVAILQLVEAGKLNLSDKITDVLKIKPVGPRADKRWHSITIRHLLEHRAGFDAKAKGSVDPMFASQTVAREMGSRFPPPPNQATIIAYALRKPLQFDPGEKFVYSNFGYCLLGRVIEKLSGQTYENYVKKHILDPLELKSVRQGKSLFHQRQIGEVRYYCINKNKAMFGPLLGKVASGSYGGFYLEAMDSNAAWLSSAPDLLKYACTFADPKSCKLLKGETVEELFARPEGEKGDAYYGRGWLVRPFGKGKRSYWHDGSLAGSSVMVVHRADGVSFAVMFNTNAEVDKTEPAGAIEVPLHKALDIVFSMK